MAEGGMTECERLRAHCGGGWGLWAATRAKARSLVFIKIANEKFLKRFCMVIICRKTGGHPKSMCRNLQEPRQDLRVAWPVVVVKGGRLQSLRSSHKSSPP